MLQLLGDEAPRPLAPRSPAISDGDTEAWAILKPRIRAELELRALRLAQLAAETAIPLSTLQHGLSPAGPAPGRLVAEKLQAWLAGQRALAEASSGESVSPSSDPKVSRPQTPLLRSKSPPSPAKPTASRPNGCPAPAAGNGHARAGALPATRLGAQQRAQLALLLERDPGRLRRVASPELAQRLCAGGEAAAEIVQRVSAWLVEDGAAR
jgi:hypothetical protein